MDISLLEAFALADDRTEAVRRLIPGTEEHSFLRCLLHQQRGELDEARSLLDAWPHRQTLRAPLLTRQLLLEASSPDSKSWEALRKGEKFDHRCQLPGKTPPLPSRVPEASVARREVLRKATLGGSVGQLSQRGLEQLLDDDELAHPLRRQVLERLTAMPRHPRLLEHVAADLGAKPAKHFGNLSIHQRLTLAQLDALLERSPELLQSEAFVNHYTALLGADPEGPADEEGRLARQIAFAERLSPTFAPRLAGLFYQRIGLRWRRGLADREGLLRYLRLTAPSWGEGRGRDALAVSGHSEPLLEAVLLACLIDGSDDFKGLLGGTFLRHKQAEAMLLAGAGDADRWASHLEPAQLRALQERVDLELSPSNPSSYGPDDDVSLWLDVKNVDSLVVRVFQIDAVSHFRARGGDVGIDLDLDGFVPNHERRLPLTPPPMVRHRVPVAVPEAKGPGTYVIDVVGGGRSCRALIRKGSLRAVERVGAAGHVLTVLDERGQPVLGATAWLGDRAFEAEPAGEIVIPFTTGQGFRSILLQRGEVTGLQSLSLRGESYQLSATFHVEQEDLIAGAEARLLIRARLTAAGGEASPSLLTSLRLTVAGSREGITSERSYENLRPSDQGEMLVSFTVPEGLEALRFTLTGELLDTRGARVAVSASGSAQSGGPFRNSNQIRSLHLLDEPGGWSLLVLGRAGEPLPDVHLSVELRHALGGEPLKMKLQSDEGGRVLLGALHGVSYAQAKLDDGTTRGWPLRRFACAYPPSLHLRAGEPLRLPVDDDDPEEARRASLFASQGSLLIRDLSHKIALHQGVLSIDDLAPGDYLLSLPGVDQPLSLRVAAGAPVAGWLVDGPRFLGPTPPPPATLRALVGKDNLTLRIEGASPRARLHLFATALAQPLPELGLPWLEGSTVPPADGAGNLYSSARTLGDEARYILDRRHAPRRPGNLLPRPGLLLNPWAVSETTMAAEKLRSGDAAYAVASAGAPASRKTSAEVWNGLGDAAAGQAPSLDFLALPSLVLANLKPDDEGLIEVPLSALEGRGVVRALLLDGDTHLARQIAVAPADPRPRDLRIQSSLDPSLAYALRGEVSVLLPGQELPLGGARYRAYDTLEKAWALLETLDTAQRCTRLDFLKRWPTLDDDQKQKHYSDHACHELHFFLYRKDRPFFDRVIAPYLASKRHLTFLDQYLLGHDVAAFRAPHAYERLNALERILLAERLGELDEEHRAQRDLLDARPHDHASAERLFRAALQADALDEESPDDIVDELENALNEAEAEANATTATQSARRARAPARKDKAKKLSKRASKPTEEDDEEEEEEVAEEKEKDWDAPTYSRRNADERELTRDVSRRAANRQLYQPLDATREYAEQHYHRQRLSGLTLALAPINPFWRDFAAHRGPGPFLSPHFTHCTDGPAAMLLALAVLDLPYQAAPHALRRDASGLTLKAASAAIVFHEQVKPVAPSAAPPILVVQRYLRVDDGGEQPVAGELLVGQRHRCQVIISNPSPKVRHIDLLLQLPEGSLPLGGARPTRSERLHLSPYETRTVDYSFYFPHPGSFRHHPAQASEDGRALSAAAPRSLAVVHTLSAVDEDAWPHLSQAGSDDQIIEALSTRNLHTIRIDQMAWRLHDRAFYDRALAVLERRRHHDPTAWSYSLFHRDLPRAAEYLRRKGHASALAIETPWLHLDPQAEGIYEHLDYAPLVNPRTHGPAGPQKILNQRLAEQVERLLLYLCSKAAPDDDDRLSFVYYLLLQDRIEHAVALFHRVDPAKIRGKIQHDYVRAYLAFFDDPARARAIAEPYASYPVDRWRDRFREVLAQLDEVEGKVALPADPTDRDQRQAHLAATAPALELRPEGDRLRLHHRHAPRCEVRFYQMDIELLFSQRPFGLQTFRERPSMRPNHTLVLEPGLGEGMLDVETPEALRGRPLMIEATCGEARATATHTAGALAVQITEAYGQLRASHAATGAPLPRVYIKVYALDAGGRERFHKDGYTDLRGRFDYASVSGADAPSQRFALLLLSDDHGAALREVNAPTR